MTPEWEDKVWGRTRCVRASVRHSLHELELKQGGFCSYHYHSTRANRFFVTDGTIRVVTSYGWDVFVSTVRAGTSFEVPSLVPHQFHVLESGKMEEEYWTDRDGEGVRADDIHRLTTGGMFQDPARIYSASGIILSEDLWTGLVLFPQRVR